MLGKILIVLILLVDVAASEDGEADFIYNGLYRENDLTMDGAANLTGKGLLRLTSAEQSQIGHAFYPKPLSLKKNTTSSSSTFSFSTTFVFAIVPKNEDASGNGFAFVMSPSKTLEAVQSGSYLGLFNITNNGDPSNHIAAIEFDTAVNKELGDINDNHVGIDINSLRSFNASPAGYYIDEDGGFRNETLMSGRRFQAWVEYDGKQKRLSVTMAPLRTPKPKRPLLSSRIDLSSVIKDPVYVGFSASTATLKSFHYIAGWSFKMNGEARPLDTSTLPKIPDFNKKSNLGVIIGVSSAAAGSVLLLIICVIVYMKQIKRRRRSKFEEVLEEWERQIGAHRVPYKDLHKGTKGFQESNVIGVGGFGKVYKGILPASKMEVAVKKVSHDSEEGTKQFLAEITSLGRLRSPNFVELLGYCRRKGELLLVYEFMKKGSLDKLLHDEPASSILDWNQRFRIIKQVASGLFYLHEKWAQAILHRDIKPANVLLDENLNGKLGDFGLSRLYEHGSDPHTTRVVGTVGYMAPELSRTGKATKASDVYAFGAVMLEVVCGRRPMDHLAPPNMIMLVDWVFDCFKEGRLFTVVDAKLLGTSFKIEELQEVEMVLKLGLLCTHDSAVDRPTIGEVLQYLNLDRPLPEVPVDSLRSGVPRPTPITSEGSENILTSSPSVGSVSIIVSGR